MKYIKGFDENLQCRGYQFEIGKEYDTGYAENLELCTNTVFHFCRSLQEVHEFYSVKNENYRFCEIEVLGTLIEGDGKCGSNKIRIVREITGEELNKLKGTERGNTGIFNTGNLNTGNRNTGDLNTGNRNTGDFNTGNRNTGDFNTGDFNTGDFNTGDFNTGDFNTGDFNTGDRSTGVFNTQERTITIFNKDSGLTWNKWVNSKWYQALKSVHFTLTEWIEYTEEEKKESIFRQCIGGYLKEYTFHEACRRWWNNVSNENRKIIMTIPNFDEEIFKEITGIDVREVVEDDE